MKYLDKTIAVEIAVICLVAACLGLLWNRNMLVNAWTGQVVSAEAAPPAQEGQNLPLPLGLMQVKEFFDRKDAFFIDARDGRDFAAGHIRGAISLPLSRAADEIPSLKVRIAASIPVIVYCNGFDCHDSRTLAEQLIRAGYQTVFIYEGGFPEWRDAGYPLGPEKS